MATRKKSYSYGAVMRVQARPGSSVERNYYSGSSLPSGRMAMPKAIASGITPSVMDDLIYHGGKLVPQMEYQNVYLGTAADWNVNDITRIDQSIKRVMQDRRIGNVMRQYFPGVAMSCDPRKSFIAGGARPKRVTEADAKAAVVALFDAGRIAKNDLGTTQFNLILPAGSVLALGSDTSLSGLGGYHGCVHVTRGGKPITLYYSANVFSQRLSSGRSNGIVAFDQSWKNVVATLYHEISEFQTDPDVDDANRTGRNELLGWTSRRGHEVGDQPLVVADSLSLIFKEVAAQGQGSRVPMQFMFSNAVHGAEGPIDSPHA